MNRCFQFRATKVFNADSDHRNIFYFYFFWEQSVRPTIVCFIFNRRLPTLMKILFVLISECGDRKEFRRSPQEFWKKPPESGIRWNFYRRQAMMWTALTAYTIKWSHLDDNSSLCINAAKTEPNDFVVLSAIGEFRLNGCGCKLRIKRCRLDNGGGGGGRRCHRGAVGGREGRREESKKMKWTSACPTFLK